MTTNMPLTQRTAILFVDPTVINDHHIQTLQTDCKQLNLTLMIFFEFQPCSDQLHQMHNERILLIVGESNGENIARIALSSSHLHTLYIICSNPSQHPTWTSSLHRSTPLFFVDIASLSHRIRMAQYDDRHAEIPFDVLSSSSSSSTLSATSRNKQEVTFMHGQLLKHVLTQMSYTQDDMDNLIKFIEQKSSNRKFSEDFRQKYRSDQALSYYTSTTMLYETLNSALRSCDFEVTYTMGIFIKDLHNSLVRLHKSLNENEELHLFRGQVIPNKDFERIQQNIGGLMSINQFFSTSTAMDVAESFALGAPSGKSGVLFEIIIDSAMSRTTSFANIKAYSKFKDEEEYLFTMGSVFRIHGVRQSTTNDTWCVSLSLTNDQDEEIAALGEFYRKNLKSPKLTDLCEFLIMTWQFEKIDTMCEMGLKSSRSVIDTSFYHLYSSMANSVLGNQLKANEHWKIIQTYLDDGSNSNEARSRKSMVQAGMALIQGDIGIVSSLMKEYQKAKQENHQYPMNEQTDADFHMLGGFLAELTGIVEDATSNYSQACEQMQRTLPSLHPQFMYCKSALTRIKSYNREEDRLLPLISSFHDVFTKITLPDSHINVLLKFIMSLLEAGGMVTKETSSSESNSQQAVCSENQNTLLQQTMMYYQQGKWDETLSTIDGILQRQEKDGKLSPSMAVCIRQIEIDRHKEQGDFATALHSLHEMENTINSFPSWRSMVSGAILLERADIYAAQNEDEEVLKILDQYRSIPSAQYPLLRRTFDREWLKSLVRRFQQRGSEYSQRGSYHEAIIAHEKALRILLEFLPDDYAHQITVYDSIAISHIALEDYSSAVANDYKIVDLAAKASLTCNVKMKSIWGRIGLVHFHLDEFDQALVAFDNQNEILINDPTSNPDELLESYKFVGLSYLLRKNVEDAVEYFKKALGIHNKHSEPFSSKVAQIWGYLGLAQRLRRNFDESLSAYKQEFQIYMAQCTPDPEKLADVYRNIGLVYMMTENFSVGKLNLEECLKIQKIIGSSDDLVLGLIYDCNAHVFYKEKQYLACDDHGSRAIEIYRRNFSRVHERIQPLEKLLTNTAYQIRRHDKIKQDAHDQKLIHQSLLETHIQKNDFEKAMFHAKKLFQIQTTFFPDNDLEICSTFCHLSTIYVSIGHFSHALHCLHESELISLKHLPRTTSLVISILIQCGKISQELGETEDALSFYDDALEMQLNFLPPDDLEIAITYRLIGSVCMTINKIDEAQSNFFKCLDIQMNKLSHDHPELIATRNILQLLL